MGVWFSPPPSAGATPAVTISSRSMHASSAACAATSDNVLAMTGFDDQVLSIDVAEPAQLIAERGDPWPLAGEKTDAPHIHCCLPTLGCEIGLLTTESLGILGPASRN